jgi:hypothetical protein
LAFVGFPSSDELHDASLVKPLLWMSCWPGIPTREWFAALSQPAGMMTLLPIREPILPR